MVTTTRPRALIQPEILILPRQRMAVVRTVGDPNVVGKDVLPALYGAVYTLKFAEKKRGRDFSVRPLRARWPDFADTPKDRWRGIWGIPVPDGTTELPQKSPAVRVALEDWEYGLVAQVLHRGPYSEEAPSVERLRRFIAEQGYEIAGAHEEEYLTRPGVKAQKTIIRYPVRRRG
jgi:hypothetical protein